MYIKCDNYYSSMDFYIISARDRYEKELRITKNVFWNQFHYLVLLKIGEIVGYRHYFCEVILDFQMIDIF